MRKGASVLFIGAALFIASLMGIFSRAAGQGGDDNNFEGWTEIVNTPNYNNFSFYPSGGWLLEANLSGTKGVFHLTKGGDLRTVLDEDGVDEHYPQASEDAKYILYLESDPYVPGQAGFLNPWDWQPRVWDVAEGKNVPFEFDMRGSSAYDPRWLGPSSFGLGMSPNGEMALCQVADTVTCEVVRSVRNASWVRYWPEAQVAEFFVQGAHSEWLESVSLKTGENIKVFPQTLLTPKGYYLYDLWADDASGFWGLYGNSETNSEGLAHFDAHLNLVGDWGVFLGPDTLIEAISPSGQVLAFHQDFTGAGLVVTYEMYEVGGASEPVNTSALPTEVRYYLNPCVGVVGSYRAPSQDHACLNLLRDAGIPIAVPQ